MPYRDDEMALGALLGPRRAEALERAHALASSHGHVLPASQRKRLERITGRVSVVPSNLQEWRRLERDLVALENVVRKATLRVDRNSQVKAGFAPVMIPMPIRATDTPAQHIQEFRDTVEATLMAINPDVHFEHRGFHYRSTHRTPLTVEARMMWHGVPVTVGADARFVPYVAPHDYQEEIIAHLSATAYSVCCYLPASVPDFSVGPASWFGRLLASLSGLRAGPAADRRGFDKAFKVTTASGTNSIELLTAAVRERLISFKKVAEPLMNVERAVVSLVWEGGERWWYKRAIERCDAQDAILAAVKIITSIRAIPLCND